MIVQSATIFDSRVLGRMYASNVRSSTSFLGGYDPYLCFFQKLGMFLSAVGPTAAVRVVESFDRRRNSGVLNCRSSLFFRTGSTFQQRLGDPLDLERSYQRRQGLNLAMSANM